MEQRRLVLFFFLIGLIANITATNFTGVVETTSGPVRGEILKTVRYAMPYAAFLGIKFGEAPVGYRRFQPSTLAKPQTEVYDAVNEGNICSQINQFTGEAIGSEDCLYLHVLTPVTDFRNATKTLKSVMAYIFPGDYVTGDCSLKDHQPDYFLENDVLYVCFNYRLGAFGFLNLGHRNASGNAGIKDQRLALQWIQANIANFGGNPKNVTLFGSSAGSTSIGYHILSDASAGLFHGGMLASGTPLGTGDFQTAVEALSSAENVARTLDVVSTDKETLLATFYNATEEQLIYASIPKDKIAHFLPSEEDSRVATQPVITRSPYEIMRTGNYNKLPMMFGSMNQESVFFLPRLMFLTPLIQGSINDLRSVGMHVPKILTNYLDFLFSGGDSRSLDTASLQNIYYILSTTTFWSVMDRTQEFFVDNNDGLPIYYFYMTYWCNASASAFPIKGAVHGDHDLYLFYTPNIVNNTDPNDPSYRTVLRMTTMWTNFAKYGNPTPDWIEDKYLGIHWPPSGSDGVALYIGDELTIGPRPIEEDAETYKLLKWPRDPNNWMSRCLLDEC